MHRPVQIVNELRIISTAYQEIIEFPDVTVILVLSMWFVVHANWIPHLQEDVAYEYTYSP